ncbi:DUF4494 domain-containing protein [Parabacteroides sp. Marseille-P3160]|uniref:DUF4494 domain-containing protein n=1 Tax=Parabacteroides sp. Marseille-P3160 TaxID=1917887 RepID=UPI0009BA336F|nr:DUF4494 domain-containing protein [Parabacteroides sp. Marseille-P3160]
MQNWFECRISYEKMIENGTQKKVAEAYLVDALSFTEAEARIIEAIRPYISGEFTVKGIRRYNVSELIYDEMGISQIDAEAQKLSGINRNASGDPDKYYRAKINFITLDEKSGREKRLASYYLIQACSVNAAHDILVEYMKGTMSDYEIVNLDETKIIDIFPYSKESDAEESEMI